MHVFEAQSTEHTHQLTGFTFRELCGEAGSNQRRHRRRPFQQGHGIGGAVAHLLCVLAAHAHTVAAADAPFRHHLGLSVNDAYGFDGTLAHAGETNAAPFFDRVDYGYVTVALAHDN